MSPYQNERCPEITGSRVRQTRTFKNVSPEHAEEIAEFVKKLTDILYHSVALEMNLQSNDLPARNVQRRSNLSRPVRKCS